MSTIKSIEITSNGTLTDFFAQLKEKILANTSFELISEDTENFTLLFNTKISDMKLKITDNQITNNQTSSSNAIIVRLLSDNLNISENSNVYYALQYSSSANTKDIQVTRTLTLLNYENNSNFSIISILPWNKTGWRLSYDSCSIGKLSTKKIDDSSIVERVFFMNRTFDLNKNNKSLWFGNIFPNVSCSGVCFVNQMLTDTSTTGSIVGKVMEYCENLYNCTNLTSGYKYNINGKTFFAIDTNILVEDE